jgi:hypothetical protein
VAHGSNGEVRSLTYVIEDNFPQLTADALQLREKSIRTGKLVTSLLRSTQSRRSKMLSALSAFFSLLSPL